MAKKETANRSKVAMRNCCLGLRRVSGLLLKKGARRKHWFQEKN